MENTATTTTRQRIVTAAKAYFKWCICYTVANTLVGWLFEQEEFTQLLWAVITVATFIKMVAIPVKRELFGEKELPKMVEPACELDLNPKVYKSESPEEALISDETLAIRRALAPDMNACFADAPYKWQWACSSTVSQIYVRPKLAERSGLTFCGELQMENGRVEAVLIHEENGDVLIPNKPLQMARLWAAKKATSPAPQHVAEEKETSTEQKVLRATVPDGKDVPAEELVADGQVRKLNRSATKTVLVSLVEDEEPVEVAEDLADDLLHPIADPPVSDDDLRRAAGLQADYDSARLSELAMSAEQNEESSFVVKWPEGLQTKKEVEFYAEILVSRAGFRKAEIDAEKLTLRLYIQCDEEYDVEDYAE